MRRMLIVKGRACVCVCVLFIRVYICICTDVYIYAYIHIYMCTYWGGAKQYSRRLLTSGRGDGKKDTFSPRMGFPGLGFGRNFEKFVLRETARRSVATPGPREAKKLTQPAPHNKKTKKNTFSPRVGSPLAGFGRYSGVQKLVFCVTFRQSLGPRRPPDIGQKIAPKSTNPPLTKPPFSLH